MSSSRAVRPSYRLASTEKPPWAVWRTGSSSASSGAITTRSGAGPGPGAGGRQAWPRAPRAKRTAARLTPSFLPVLGRPTRRILYRRHAAALVQPALGGVQRGAHRHPDAPGGAADLHRQLAAPPGLTPPRAAAARRVRARW